MENGTRRFTYDSKTSGDLIRSQDWNKAMQEIVDLGEDIGRLGDITLSKAGGSLTGPLTVEAALQVHGTVKATRFEGDGSGLTGLTLSQWTATTAGRGIFYTSGPVGIGTATPTETLEIQGTVKATRFVGDGSGLTGIQGGGGGSSQWTSAANGAIHYAGGNVGIGTTTPKGFQVALPESRKESVAPGPGVTIAGGPEGNASIELRNNGSGTPYIDFALDGTSDFDARIRLGAKNQLGIEGTYVGIGTANPGAKLHIVDQNRDANGSTLVLGPVDQSNLRLGYHADYSWVQSHGSKPLAINPSGNNVGIGISAPTETLEVRGTVKATRFVGDGSGLTGIQGGGGGSSQWATNPAGRAISYSAGNVGLGTANPVALLDIQAAARTDLPNHPTAVKGVYVTSDFAPDSGVEIRHSNGSQGIGLGYNTIYATGSNPNQELNLKARGTSAVTVQGQFAVTGTVNFGAAMRQMLNFWSQGYGIGVQGYTQYFRTDKNFAWYKGGSHHDAELNPGANGAVQMVLNNGNVGIGTPTPSAKLQVAGGAIMPTAGNSEAAGIMFPKDPFGGGGDAAWIRYYPREGETTTFEIGTSNDVDDHIALMASGNVGIGTTSPGAKLQVTGPVMEQLEMIQCNRRGDWSAQDHPIMQYFKAKLTGKPVGTYIKAIQDYPDWRGHYWQGWVDADRRIRVIHNANNTQTVVI